MKLKPCLFAIAFLPWLFLSCNTNPLLSEDEYDKAKFNIPSVVHTNEAVSTHIAAGGEEWYSIKVDPAYVYSVEPTEASGAPTVTVYHMDKTTVYSSVVTSNGCTLFQHTEAEYVTIKISAGSNGASQYNFSVTSALCLLRAPGKTIRSPPARYFGMLFRSQRAIRTIST